MNEQTVEPGMKAVSIIPNSRTPAHPSRLVFDMSVILPLRRQGKEAELLKRLEDVERDYREQNAEFTIDFEITGDAFRKLEGRPGMKVTGKNHLVKIMDVQTATYHLIVSPYTNVSEIRTSGKRDSRALTLSAGGLSMAFDEQLGFELAEVSSKGVADVGDRSQLYLKDIAKIELIPIETANLLTQETDKNSKH